MVLEYIRSHPGCHRRDIAGELSMDCDHVHEVVVALSLRGLAYQNQESREHFSIVDGWAR
jgi:DNA-binding MarR family transcriptional regulator